MIDAEEYLHLAVHAIQLSDHHKALEYLHKLLELQPGNADAIYLMAAEHAEIGMIDRAISEIELAIDINPNLEMAAFQLGQLYLQEEKIPEAKQVWQNLLDKKPSENIELFTEGMLYLVDAQYEKSNKKIRKGLELTTTNIALRNAMESLCDNVEQLVKSGKPEATDASQQENAKSKKHVAEKEAEKKGVYYLGAYKDQSLKDD